MAYRPPMITAEHSQYQLNLSSAVRGLTFCPLLYGLVYFIGDLQAPRWVAPPQLLHPLVTHTHTHTHTYRLLGGWNHLNCCILWWRLFETVQFCIV